MSSVSFLGEIVNFGDLASRNTVYKVMVMGSGEGEARDGTSRGFLLSSYTLATQCPVLALVCCYVIHTRYAVSGTDIGYAAIVIHTRYAVSGTDLGCAATSRAHSWRARVWPGVYYAPTRIKMRHARMCDAQTSTNSRLWCYQAAGVALDKTGNVAYRYASKSLPPISLPPISLLTRY
eukprot:3696511-Rhodomonas_salina.2